MQMKKIHDKLCSLINELKANYGTLDSLRKGLKVVTPFVPVDVYYKFLLASAGIRKVIEISGGVIRKTEMSFQQPKMAIIENEERTK
jgi:hypothetical protein